MYKAIVVGSGCAGLACALRLNELKVRNIALITEDLKAGTSLNAGSDKQTYYKLSLGGDEKDSVVQLACDLYAGGGMNGETALVEAAGSARAFMYLNELGIKFPTNEFGEYIGYQTDHDMRKRAVSCGPLTSKYMAETLLHHVKLHDIEIFDYLRAVKIIVEDNAVCGVVFIDTRNNELVKIDAENIIIATGGEASLYENSVFPKSQWGGMGLFCDAGAALCNMNSWQYGIASTDFRWNLSGSYQQALPKYVIRSNSGHEKDLLSKYFDDPKDALNRAFLKGYQWPFDVKKLKGSSYLDIAVYYETAVLKNSVFLDFTHNPSYLENGFDVLSPECFSYLDNCNALLSTPVERLRAINEKAYGLYLSHNIDLEKDYLKIGVCAQHQNGGAVIDKNYETDIYGLFAIGECAGVFGAYRPGGSALNSTQVGALRVAQCICARKEAKPPLADEKVVSRLSLCLQNARLNNGVYHGELLNKIQKKMSRYASLVRDTTEIQGFLEELLIYARDYYNKVSLGNDPLLPYLKTLDTLLTACAVLSAAKKSAECQGSVGSSFVCTKENILTAQYEACEENLQKIVKTKDFKSELILPTPIPKRELWFESLL